MPLLYDVIVWDYYFSQNESAEIVIFISLDTVIDFNKLFKDFPNYHTLKGRMREEERDRLLIENPALLHLIQPIEGAIEAIKELKANERNEVVLYSNVSLLVKGFEIESLRFINKYLGEWSDKNIIYYHDPIMMLGHVLIDFTGTISKEFYWTKLEFQSNKIKSWKDISSILIAKRETFIEQFKAKYGSITIKRPKDIPPENQEERLKKRKNQWVIY